jgi:hypothetical protein
MSHNRSTRYPKKEKQPEKAKPLMVAFAGIVLVLMASLALFRPISAALNDAFSSGSPSLNVDKEKVDLGDVILGKSVSVTFHLTNVGKKTLRFSKDPYIEIVKGCWAPSPAISSMALKPGESATLSMDFSMHGDMKGLHDFRVHLPNNDPQQPDRTLTVLSNWVQ